MKKLLFLLPLMILLAVSNTVEAKKKKYPNGDYYEGEWKKGQPNGIGKMTYVNGDTYEGNWIMGERNGIGKMIYFNDDIYEGNWKKGEQDGFGKMTYDNGDIYEGNWKEGEQDGLGKMQYAIGCVYEGEWVKGEAIGQGKCIDKFKNTFEGYFEEERPRTGKLILIDGGYSEGEFLSSSIIDDIVSLSESCKLYNGICEKYIQNIGSFTGKILRSKYDEGKLIMSNGGWIEGKWIEGIFYDGKCDANIGDSYYQGEWKNGIFYNGKSKGKIKNDFYNGEWINGEFQGVCKIKFTSNERSHSFEGNIYANGVMNGKVVYSNNS